MDSLPIGPLLTLSRVDYLNGAMLCIETAVSLRALRQRKVLQAETFEAFRTFLPEFLGVDEMALLTTDSVSSVSLLALTPAMRKSNLVVSNENRVSAYLLIAQELEATIGQILNYQTISAEVLEKFEVFCRELASWMISAVERANREHQSLALAS